MMIKKLFFAFSVTICSTLLLNGMGEMHPSGLSLEYVERVKKDHSATDADKNIEEIVRQGVRDHGIKNKVIVLKSEHENGSPASAEKLSDPDAYLVRYRPWWLKVTFQKEREQSKFAFRPDLLPDMQESIATISEPIKEDVHPQTTKLVLLHELAHIKHGDCDRKSIEESRDTFRGYTSLALMPLCLLAAWKWGPSWANLLKINAASLLVVSGALYCYNRYLLSQSRKTERAADDAAYKVLLKNNDIKPIVHWILDRQLFLHARVPFSPALLENETHPTTHPSTQERINLAIKAILESKIRWTHELYRAILDELKDDPQKNYKIKYLNILHRRLLDAQGMKFYSAGSIENKKLYQNAVLTGEKPAYTYLNVKKWA
jgi:Zn-dependent protease with chaperone function